MLLPQKFFIIFTVRKVGRAWQNLHWNNFMFYIYQKYFTKIILILVLFLFFKIYWFNHKLSVIWLCSLGKNQISKNLSSNSKFPVYFWFFYSRRGSCFWSVTQSTTFMRQLENRTKTLHQSLQLHERRVFSLTCWPSRFHNEVEVFV